MYFSCVKNPSNKLNGNFYSYIFACQGAVNIDFLFLRP